MTFSFRPLIATAFVVTLTLMSATVASAQSPAVAPAPTLTGNTNSIWFDNWTGLSDATLKVAAPDGTITTETAASRSPVFRLKGTRIPEGIYRFELRAATQERIKVRRNDQPTPGAGQDDERPEEIPKMITVTGAFKVTRGAILLPSGDPEGKS